MSNLGNVHKYFGRRRGWKIFQSGHQENITPISLVLRFQLGLPTLVPCTLSTRPYGWVGGWCEVSLRQGTSKRPSWHKVSWIDATRTKVNHIYRVKGQEKVTIGQNVLFHLKQGRMYQFGYDTANGSTVTWLYIGMGQVREQNASDGSLCQSCGDWIQIREASYLCLKHYRI